MFRRLKGHYAMQSWRNSPAVRVLSRAVILSAVHRCGGLLPVARNYVKPLVRFDQRLLRRFPRLEYYATVKVIELVK
jgi:hypothetical protein